MTQLEKALRYICLEENDNETVMIARYKTIERMVHGDETEIERYAKMYDMLLELLCS